jgi:hypothetical protein
MPPTEQACRLAELRRGRYGDLLARHVVLLCAAGRSPTESAAVLVCSRSSVYRVGKAARAGRLAGALEGAGAEGSRRGGGGQR